MRDLPQINRLSETAALQWAKNQVTDETVVRLVGKAGYFFPSSSRRFFSKNSVASLKRRAFSSHVSISALCAS